MATTAHPPKTTRRKRSSAAEEGLQLSFWETPAPAPAPAPVPATAPAKRRKKRSSATPEIAKQVGEEILGGGLKPAEWAAALADAGDSDGRAVAEYARIRMEQLSQQHIHTRRKELEMEMRRRHSCGSPTANVRRKRSHQEKPSLFGLLLTFLGLWGLCAAFHARIQPAAGSLLFWSSGLTAVALLAMLIGGYFLSGSVVQHFFGGARTIGVGSLLCGFSLLAAISVSLRPQPSRTAADTAPR